MLFIYRRLERAKMNAEIEKENRIRRRAVDEIKLYASNEDTRRK